MYIVHFIYVKSFSFFSVIWITNCDWIRTWYRCAQWLCLFSIGEPAEYLKFHCITNNNSPQEAIMPKVVRNACGFDLLHSYGADMLMFLTVCVFCFFFHSLFHSLFTWIGEAAEQNFPIWNKLNCLNLNPLLVKLILQRLHLQACRNKVFFSFSGPFKNSTFL